MSIILFDLDGTLANHDHRLQTAYNAEDPDWDLFEAECAHDELIVPTAEILIAFQNIKHRIWLWTGRSDNVRKQTEGWLSKHALPYHQLLMRPHGMVFGDSGAQLKRRWLNHAPIPKDEVLCAFDDDPAVIAMLQEEGIQSYRVVKPS